MRTTRLHECSRRIQFCEEKSRWPSACQWQPFLVKAIFERKSRDKEELSVFSIISLYALLWWRKVTSARSGRTTCKVNARGGRPQWREDAAYFPLFLFNIQWGRSLSLSTFLFVCQRKEGLYWGFIHFHITNHLQVYTDPWIINGTNLIESHLRPLAPLFSFRSWLIPAINNTLFDHEFL